MNFFMNLDNDNEKIQYPVVPQEAIVNLEDEKPMKRIKKAEEELPEGAEGKDVPYLNNDEDMDGDGTLDWDPAVGSY